MKKRSLRLFFTLLLLSIGLLIVSLAGIENEECTTAVVSGLATKDGCPILWKNRDTGYLSNKVILVNEKPFSYLALINADDLSGRIAWAGLNSAGFAIMNSVAYNLSYKQGDAEKREGIIMADSLRTCATVNDFENYIKRNLSPNMGCRTNFGVIDAAGSASLFEVHNHGYKRLDAEDFPEKYIINTNFSRSGEPEKGKGYLRFDRATTLFKSIPQGKLTHENILQMVSRDLGHALLDHPCLKEWNKFPPDKPFWIHANHTINRVYTASVFVIHGVKKGENPRKATMWIILGEPVCSIAVPLWVDAGQPPCPLWEGKTAPICREALRIKKILRPFKETDKAQYLNITKLDNSAQKGWLPLLLKTEKEIFEKTRDLIQGNPSSSELAEFEKKIALKVLSTLKKIK